MENHLTVTINLTADQREALALAVKGKSYNPLTRNNTVELTETNVLLVREAVVQLFRTKFKQKTKTAHTMSTCFACERIIDKIDNILDTFGMDAPEEPLDDGELGIVSITQPSLTAKEAVAETVDGAASGDMESTDKLIQLLGNKPEEAVVEDKKGE